MKAYETIFVLTPDSEEERIQECIARVSEIITSGGGEVTEVNEWGKRRLAYEVAKKYNEGYYVLITFTGNAAILQELTRVYGITEDIFRHIVVEKVS
ncbi:MAG: 30S ribosomal protein S6 [Eubacteriaceae bacterium]|jgi:small subunit ribosomal protein S6|nr:30S ribosomal protein S6 [Eubacteriaceae bacterium]